MLIHHCIFCTTMMKLFVGTHWPMTLPESYSLFMVPYVNLWLPKDNRLPKLMDTQVAEALFANITCTMEIQRAELFNVLMDAYNNHDTDTNHVMFQEQPDKFMYAYKTLRLRIWCSSLSQTGSATLLRLSPRALMLL